MAFGENEQLRPFVPHIGKRGDRLMNGIALNEHYTGDGDHKHACALGCKGVSCRSAWAHPYRAGGADCWIKVKHPAAPAVTREAEEEWN
jgi:hypothetical protein